MGVSTTASGTTHSRLSKEKILTKGAVAQVPAEQVPAVFDIGLEELGFVDFYYFKSWVNYLQDLAA